MPLRSTTKVVSAVAIYMISNLLLGIAGWFSFYWASTPEEPNLTGQAVGIGLLSAAIAGLSLTGYVLVSDTTRNRIQILWEIGFRDIFHTNTTSIAGEYGKRFQEHQKSIDLLGTGLERLRRDFGASFAAWAQSGKVRLLVIDPYFPCRDFPISKARDREEGNSGSGIEGQVRAFEEHTRVLRETYPETFEVRAYRCTPTLTLVRIGKELFWAPYLVNKTPSEAPTMLVKEGGILYETLMEHFEYIWSDYAVPIENLYGEASEASAS